MAASDLWSLLLLVIVVILEAYALVQVGESEGGREGAADIQQAPASQHAEVA